MKMIKSVALKKMKTLLIPILFCLSLLQLPSQAEAATRLHNLRESNISSENPLILDDEDDEDLEFVGPTDLTDEKKASGGLFSEYI